MTIINEYAPNYRAPGYLKEMLMELKGDIDSHTIVMRDFSTPLSAMDRSTRQKVVKEITDLIDAIDQKDLTDIYRDFHPTATEYTYFSPVPGIFSRIDHMLSHKASLNKFKKFEIMYTYSLTTME